MKIPWNNMISLLPLQEFMSLTSVQGRFCTSALCFIFYVNSLYVAWTLHQVPPKLLYLLICIKLIVALAPTIPRVSPSLSSIFTSTLSVPSYDVVMVAPPFDLVMHPPMQHFIRDYAMTLRYSLNLLSLVEILS
ncbi:hypothetical protein B296_00031796 [Ensete ventricosum]|uniref:Uncharacterized protein n=1 Tax=Ensete ventricosum TaxID=4639 RepID=A0A427A4L7_ENSVE|nr:hypothetical protein B296_00031796 [Ensete ventricosum]